MTANKRKRQGDWRSAWLVGALACLLALGGCDRTPTAPMAVGLNAWVGFDPLVLARDRQLLDGDLVKVVELPSGTEVQRALENGLLDAAAMTLDETMRMVDAGLPLRIVALLDTSHGADMIVAHPAIKRPEDLRDQFVAVEGSSVGALLLYRMLQTTQMPRGAIKVVNLDVNTHLAALRDGSVAAAVTYAPLSVAMIEAGYRPVFTSRDIAGEIVDVLVVRQDVLNTRPGAVDALLRGWGAGVDALRTDPTSAGDALSRGTGMRAPAYLSVLEGLQLLSLAEGMLRLQTQDKAVYERSQRVGKALEDIGLVRQARPLAELVDLAPLQRVLADTVPGGVSK
ncbi:MAG: ABC transporter substrate-binding protein [Hydrogenophaga sp.]|uniref:ABC transporter substrate-binding protein n=1 Tax=Hydrogenophaga sp. TaxID=1904254 RepID=UPI001DD1CE17|nr:ABC transporter substrate-binding protein [Hydrogenophaga sp.]MBX3609637.1 ABC transporter substrate-binding protein [Hydrogenophaga sp.]